MVPERVFIGLGANLGDAGATLRTVLSELMQLSGTSLVAASSLYRTAPVDAEGPDFINAVAELSTALEPEPLLDALQAIEAAHARVRPYRHAPRTIDLDLLLYGARHIDSERLTVPHARLHQRAFVLLPLLEVAPLLDVPGLGPAALLVRQIQDQRVERLP